MPEGQPRRSYTPRVGDAETTRVTRLALDSVVVARDHLEVGSLVIQCVTIFVVNLFAFGRFKLSPGLLSVGHLGPMLALLWGHTASRAISIVGLSLLMIITHHLLHLPH